MMDCMTTQEVKEFMDNKKDVYLIDVREKEEVKTGKIPGAYILWVC